jgi:hypothetical protein
MKLKVGKTCRIILLSTPTFGGTSAPWVYIEAYPHTLDVVQALEMSLPVFTISGELGHALEVWPCSGSLVVALQHYCQYLVDATSIWGSPTTVPYFSGCHYLRVLYAVQSPGVLFTDVSRYTLGS